MLRKGLGTQKLEKGSCNTDHAAFGGNLCSVG